LKQKSKTVRNASGPVVLLGLVIICLIGLQGCIFVPILDGFNNSGVTSTQRAAKLSKAVKEFQDYVFWGDVEKALNLADPEHRKEINKALLNIPKDERVVETKMLSADYSEDAYDADVVVQTKSFNKNTLTVYERNVSQKWVFYMSSGWLITEFGDVREVG